MSKDEKQAESTRGKAPAGQRSASAQAPSGGGNEAKTSGLLPTLSLPKGGGAIRGIGEKFSTNPVTGTGSLSISIATSPGRAGFELGLALQYDSGAGNGPFGIGWTLSTPAITRKTDKGLPRYEDATDSDTFILSGAEDLVPVRLGDGAETRLDIIERGDHRVQRYRPRTEGLFARIERWTDRTTGDVHWRVTTRDNVLTIYGRSPAARISDPEHPEHVFSWLIEETRDDRGNIVRYTYKPEDAAGVPLGKTSESNRFEIRADGSHVLRATAQRYLKRIQYGNRAPVLDREAPAPSGDGDYLFEVVLDYGEHDDATPTPAEVRPWAVRHDAFSSYRATFEVRTYRLCRRVLMFHRFAEFGPTPCLVRSTDFSYDEGPAVTYLQAATQAGYKRNDESGTYLRATLPPLELGYIRPVIHDELRTIDRDSLEGIHSGVDGTGAQWVDLDGEGIPGVLIPAERAWFYKANLGGGHLAPPALLHSLPSPAQLGSGVQQLTDLDGNGWLELVQYAPPLSGYFERTPEGGWAPFMALPSLPNIDWRAPNLRFIDLDGDGFPDVLITEDHTFVWYRSRTREGFAPAVILSKAKDELKGPTVIFADICETIQLADMSGDGLVDIVRVRNGEVCYWPNLGYGRFGCKITLELSAPFDAPDQFDPKRIRFADIDGSGTSDIIYLGRDGVRLYFNHAGNGLSAPVKLESLRPIDSLSSLSVVDLLGQGTACLVWSSPVPGSQNRPLAYVDLLGGKKPHVLEKVVNNLGAETRVQYAPSTRFYLADKAGGKPWITRLSFPVHVVERVETYDHISRNRFVTRYAYHHGYFDGVEREFRGFGMVEQWDTEELGALSADGTLPAASNIDAASHVPPVLTKTWFHTGAFLENRRISRQFEAEYYREPGLSDTQFDAQLLPDTTLDPAWSFEEMGEACRALRGSILRQEIYALDGSAASAHPYSVSERSYAVMRLQQRVGEYWAVLFVHPREAITYHYEREPADPRIQHELTLEVDSFGNVLNTAVIGYGRRRPDPELPARDQAEQARTLITYSENDFTDSVNEDSAYRTPQPCESRSCEIMGLSLAAGHDRFVSGQILGAGQAAAPIDYEQAPTPGLLQKRLIECVRMLYRRDDLSGPLALGKLESRALPYESYTLAFTPGLITLVYGDRVTGSMLENDGYYVHSEGDAGWWIPSGQAFYSPDPNDTPAQELNEASEHFFLPRRLKDPFGHSTIVTYDLYDVLVQETRDAIGNCVTAGARDAAGHLIENGNDYRVLQPRVIMDPNRNRSAVAFDALGLVVGTAIMGKPEENLGDSLAGFEPDLPAEVIAAHLGDPLADPHGILQRATTRLVHDLYAYHRTQGTPEPQPAIVYTLARETHDADLLPGQKAKIQHVFSYSDGFGREIQMKMQAEPGPLVPGEPEINPRWVGSGWTIFNNKGKPVRQYEPFFTGAHHFEFDVRIGVSPVLFYDPVERVVATLHPNHTWEKVVLDPWRQETWDVNDTVLVADPKTDPDVGDFFRRLPDADYLPTWYAQRQGGALGLQEQAAARKTTIHAETLTVAHADSLGRTFLTVAYNRFKYSNTPLVEPPVEEFYSTRVNFDIEGNQREVIDAKDRVVMRYGYDMLGNPIHQASMEAGERWLLSDVAGNPIRAWDSRRFLRRMTYDELRRPTGLYVVENGAERLAERTVYGESQGDAANHCTRVHQLFDSAGMITRVAYDFKGNLREERRDLLPNYKQAVDWLQSPAVSDGSFTNRTTFDALNRPLTATSPDGSIYRPTFNEANLLDKVDVNLRGAAVAFSFVTNIDYNAKGQRKRITYGNGATTTFDYDPLSFRLTHLNTTRPESADAAASQLFQDTTVVQDLRYTYDPTGNIIRIEDAALKTVFHDNQQVDPVASYTYDALYRLIEAQGREHIGQTAFNFNPPRGSARDYPFVGHAHPNELQALRNYTERYEYDAVGNFEVLRHVASGGSWTRRYDYEEGSLIEADKVSNRMTRTTVGNGLNRTEQYSHDSHGNMTAMPHLVAMTWNFADQLEEVDLGGGGTIYYVYDGAGQRMRKVVESQNGRRQKERIYLGGYEIYREYGGGSGSVSLERETLHVMDEKQRIALVETKTVGDGESLANPLPILRCQLGNHLGSACLELEASGGLISYEEYHPYGTTSFQAMNTAAEVSLKRYRYVGLERDEETGFAYHGARYYASWLGRWVSPDPIGITGGMNIYEYGSSAPSTRIDLHGLEDKEADAIARVLQEAADTVDEPKKRREGHSPRGTRLHDTLQSVLHSSDFNWPDLQGRERVITEVIVDKRGMILGFGGKVGGSPKGSVTVDAGILKPGMSSDMPLIGKKANDVFDFVVDYKSTQGGRLQKKQVALFTKLKVPLLKLSAGGDLPGQLEQARARKAKLSRGKGTPSKRASRQRGGVDPGLMGDVAAIMGLVALGKWSEATIETGKAGGAAVGAAGAARLGARAGSKAPGLWKIPGALVGAFVGGCLMGGECNPVDAIEAAGDEAVALGKDLYNKPAETTINLATFGLSSYIIGKTDGGPITNGPGTPGYDPNRNRYGQKYQFSAGWR